MKHASGVYLILKATIVAFFRLTPTAATDSGTSNGIHLRHSISKEGKFQQKFCYTDLRKRRK